MALTDKEKRLFIAPVILGVLLFAVVLFNGYMSSQNRALQALLHQANVQINENQSTLMSLENLDLQEASYSRYRLDDWIPLFTNEVAVRLYLHHRISQGLEAVAGREIQLTCFPVEQSDTPNYTDFVLTAAFPSFSAMVHFLEKLEQTTPPFLIVGALIDKDGITINANVTIRFNYRLNHETI